MIAYSDKLDGRIQISFSLQVSTDKSRAKALGELYCKKLGLKNVLISSFREIEKHTHHTTFGNSEISVDLNEVVSDDVNTNFRSKYEIEKEAEEYLIDDKKVITVVGASLESDAHTVGLDAILNPKGYKGDYGLERYSCFKVYNLGAQVEIPKLIEYLKEVKADVLLVSQTVSQNDIHLKHFQQLADAISDSKLDVSILIGGMHVTNSIAKCMGYVAGFGRDTTPSMVASVIMDEMRNKYGLVKLNMTLPSYEKIERKI